MEEHAADGSRRNFAPVACLGVAGAAIVAVTVFKVPIGSVFFFGMIILCPLMHLFMGHGAHGHGASEASKRSPKPVVPSETSRKT